MPNGPCCNRLCSAPPPRRGAGHPSTPCAPSSTRSATWSAPAAPGGCCPTTSPQPGTGYWRFAKWAADGTLDRIHDALRGQVRVQAGRRPAPSAAVIDSQSVRAADTVPRASRGWDAGKKVNGRKRHLAVDTMGLLLVVMVTAAGVQDRDAARALLWRLRGSSRGIRLVWADGGYAGKLVAWAQAMLHLAVEIVRKRPGQSTFEVLPRRWVVERTLCAARRSVVSPA